MTRRLRIAGFLGATVIRMLGRTWRIRFIDESFEAAARRLSPSVIYTLWHGRFLALVYSHRNSSAHVLASEHRDGELVGEVIRFLGFGRVRGSSTRGGARAIRELVQKLEAGFDLAITVDGPRGPRHVCKPGSVEIAKLSGSVLLPITVSSRRHVELSSWDGFQLPWPFTRVFVRFGRPVSVPGDATPEVLEGKRREVEGILRALTEENDASVAAGQ